MLTQTELKKWLKYDPETGIFTRRITWYGKLKGSVVGALNDQKYLTVVKAKKHYRLHRLAFLYMSGYFPEHQVDHINGIRNDNRWCNLRHVTRNCNLQNTNKHCANKSGYKGVSWDNITNLYYAQIRVQKTTYFLGRYEDPLDAALARITFEDWCDKWHCDARNWNRDKVFKDLAEMIKISDVSGWVLPKTKLGKSNTSGYCGTCKISNGRFQSKVDYQNKQYHLGTFNTAKQAAVARDKFIIKNDWPHKLNFPELRSTK